MPGSPADRSAFRRHKLDRRQFQALAAGGGDTGTVSGLLAAERSWRLLQLRAVLDALRSRPEATGPLPPIDVAWELLARAQQRNRSEVDTLLLLPQAGTWAGYALRRLRGSIHSQTPLWVDVGYLHTLAAAAAVRAGLDFGIRVPVRDGYAVLPTLGAVRLPERVNCDYVDVRHHQGSTVIEAAGTAVAIRSPSGPAAGWIPLPVVRVAVSEHTLVVNLECLDPYRNLRGPTPPQPLTGEQVTHWRDLLAGAWRLLVDVCPHVAAPLARGLLSVVPQPPAKRFRTMSASSGDAFGSMIVSELRDPTDLAVAMVHEFQHIKLGGLLHLTRLHEGEPPQPLYAPWRDDPRPLGGVLQGVYAFTGITEFWRAARLVLTGAAGQLAQFEFARWRRQVWRTLRMLAEIPQLTEVGKQLVAGLTATAAGWRDAPVPARLRAAADVAGADHSARWRLHHLRPDPDLVATLAAAWIAGSARPEVPYPDPAVEADPAARGLDTQAVLAHWRMSDPDGFARLRDDPEAVGSQVAGAIPADLAYVAGELDHARQLYLTELTVGPGRPGAWAGLGLVLTAAGPGPVTAALRQHPELVRAVHQAVRRSTGVPADPVELAAWLGGA